MRVAASAAGFHGVGVNRETVRVAWSLVQLLTLTGARWGDLLVFSKMLEPATAAYVAQHSTADEWSAIAEVAERGIAPDDTGYHEFH